MTNRTNPDFINMKISPQLNLMILQLTMYSGKGILNPTDFYACSHPWKAHINIAVGPSVPAHVRIKRNSLNVLKKSGNGELCRRLWSYLDVRWNVTILTANLHEDVPAILQAWTFASLSWACRKNWHLCCRHAQFLLHFGTTCTLRK